ncbi:TIM barrel protein [Goodfellowiella coeruleoviolacea]|uniref:2-keto-myo-inositol dehydratase n=1 Tax=Goodfellowiella coeruleoviolacea TaxID=334858 RepID=A0AAE3KJ37_9PSEU|nr:TIM barrel protein [Goodfellowiella coeruleoviolacea]MCP2163913.1 2-keto-myo-inositol dehydratase (EC 4.2.1.44) [Goodfellowiella coeruleoviolacea]
MTAGLRLAGAPISWGVSEVPGWGRVLDADLVLGQMAELGLAATELGPPGYLPADPVPLLARHGLGLVGGFLAVPLHDPATERSTVDTAAETAALIARCGGEVLVLAAATGLAGYDERPALDDRRWRTLVATAARVAEVVAGHGVRTVLHPHVGTHVETEAEVERFLADSSLPLCLDTGHLLVGGTDPVALARRHADRIGHVHLKDVRAELAAQVRANTVPFAAAVARGLFVPLGDGDVDTGSVIRSVHAAGYRGWYVLEQDTALTDQPGAADAPRRDTARSLAHLARLAPTLSTPRVGR